MSYILDALRRADSERERERSAVPGLHTQAVPVGAPEGETDAPAHPWKWPIAVAFVALLGLVAWLWFGRAEAPKPALPLTSAPASSAPAAPLAAPAAAPAAPAPAPVAAAGPPAAPVAASAAPVREPAPATARKPPAPAASAKKSPASAAAAASAAPRAPAKASEPEVKISPLNELPDEVRRALPAITVSGSIYSKSATNRMLVINGQVFHEGDELATGLVLEQIRQKSAVLKFKTYRYEITY